MNIWETVMRFYVSVPVLSEQIAVVDPNVSTVYIFFTKTNYLARIDAASPRHTVIVAIRPSGMQETIIPMLKVKLVNIS
jgi:hypothetical protein